MSGHGQDDGGRSSLPEQLHAHLHPGPGSSSGTSSPAATGQPQAQAPPPQQHPHSQLSTPHPPGLSAEYPHHNVPVGYPVRQQQQYFTPQGDPARTYFGQPQQQQQQQYAYQPQLQPPQQQPQHASPSGWRQEHPLGYGEQYGWRSPAQAESYVRRSGNEPHDMAFGARNTGFGARELGYDVRGAALGGRDPGFGGARSGYSLQGYSDIRSSRSPPPPPPPTQQPGYDGLPPLSQVQHQHASYYASPLDDPHASSSTPFTGFLQHEHALGYSGYDRYPQSDLRLPQPGGTGREDVQYGHPLPPGLLGLDTHYGSQQNMLSSPVPGPSTSTLLSGPGTGIPSSQGSLLGTSSDPLGFPSSYEYASDPEHMGTLSSLGSTPTPITIPVGTPHGSSSAGGSSGRRAEDDDDDGKATKKRKVEIACNFCRQRKLKCSGTRPACDACIKRDQAERCEYELYPRRRGPGKRQRGTRRPAQRTRADAQGQGFGVMSPTMNQAGPSRSQAPLTSQVNYGHQHQSGPSFMQIPSHYGQPRAGPSSQTMEQTPGPSEYGGYGVLGYTLPSPIAPPSLGPYLGSMGGPGPSGEEQRRHAEQQRQYEEEEERRFKEEPHGY